MLEDYVVGDNKKNAVLYNYVVVLAHWGKKNTFKPDVSTDKMAKTNVKSWCCYSNGRIFTPCAANY